MSHVCSEIYSDILKIQTHEMRFLLNYLNSHQLSKRLACTTKRLFIAFKKLGLIFWVISIKYGFNLLTKHGP